MDVGLYFKWGKPVPGHEREALELYGEAFDYWTEKKKTGIVTWFEPFLFQTTDFERDGGFWVIRGPEEKLLTLFKEPKFRHINLKAGLFLEHFTTGMLYVGEGITEIMGELAKVYAEVGV